MKLNRRMLLRATAAGGLTATGAGIGTRPAAASELEDGENFESGSGLERQSLWMRGASM